MAYEEVAADTGPACARLAYRAAPETRVRHQAVPGAGPRHGAHISQTLSDL